MSKELQQMMIEALQYKSFNTILPETEENGFIWCTNGSAVPTVATSYKFDSILSNIIKTLSEMSKECNNEELSTLLYRFYMDIREFRNYKCLLRNGAPNIMITELKPAFAASESKKCEYSVDEIFISELYYIKYLALYMSLQFKEFEDSYFDNIKIVMNVYDRATGMLSILDRSIPTIQDQYDHIIGYNSIFVPRSLNKHICIHRDIDNNKYLTFKDGFFVCSRCGKKFKVLQLNSLVLDISEIINRLDKYNKSLKDLGINTRNYFEDNYKNLSMIDKIVSSYVEIKCELISKNKIHTINDFKNYLETVKLIVPLDFEMHYKILTLMSMVDNIVRFRSLMKGAKNHD